MTELQNQVIESLKEDKWNERDTLSIAMGTKVLIKEAKLCVFYPNGSMKLYVNPGEQLYIPTITLN